MDLIIGFEDTASGQVLRLKGRLNNEAVTALEQALAERPAPGVWELSELEYISSAGLRVLVSHEKRRRAAGAAQGILVGMRPTVLEVFKITGLARFWTQANTLADLPATPIRHPSSVDCIELLPGIRTERITLPSDPMHLVRWQAAGLTAVCFAELKLAFGRGGLGVQRQVAAQHSARFATIHRLLSWVDDEGEGDTLEVADPSQQFLRIDSAWAIEGEPALGLRLLDAVDVASLRTALPRLTGKAWHGVLALIPTSNGSRLCLAVLGPAQTPRTDIAEITLTDLHLPTTPEQVPLRAALDLIQPDAGLPLQFLSEDTWSADTRLWLWPTDEPTASDARSLQIELPASAIHHTDETELIVRSLYTGCRRVVLSPLTGGFSAATWQIDSYDSHQRRLLPTVLKVGPADMMKREHEAHGRYVVPFILNNATVGLGTAEHGDRVGLRYNFIGVTSDHTQLQTLARRWSDGHEEQTIDLYSTLSRETLSPWYAQTREADAALYTLHTPLRLFPFLLDVARDVLGAAIDSPTLPCPALGRDLPNPWWHLQHTFPGLQHTKTRCRVCITHGDLNLNNVLVDERDNLYVIDFSETAERSAASDFARLEPVFLIEQATLDDDASEALWLHDMARIYATIDPCTSLPVQLGTVSSARGRFVSQLRQLARDTLGPEANAESYLLPVLEWTLPIILFSNRPLRLRKASTWAAALILERLHAASMQM